MHTRSPRILAVLACGIAVCLLLFRVVAAEPEYELSQPTTVEAGGQAVQLPAGQPVGLMGGLTPDQSGNIMVKVTLPNGSVTIAQIPASGIRPKGSGPAVAAVPTTPTTPAMPAADSGLPPAAATTPRQNTTRKAVAARANIPIGSSCGRMI